MSYSEDTTDLERRGIMDRTASALRGFATDMTLAKGSFTPGQEMEP